MPLELSLTGLPFMVAFAVAMIFAPGTIAALKRRNLGQTISADQPESHSGKAGTPTMGGLIIIAGILAGALVVSYSLSGSSGLALPTADHARAQDLLGVLLLMLGFALIGLVDDYLTIHPVRGVRGIASKPKAAAQILLVTAFVIWLAQRPESFLPALSAAGTPILAGNLYWVFAVVFIVGMANFVNITDGLDGLASGLISIAAVAYVAILMLVPPHVGFDNTALIGLAMAIGGSCLAFLWFNSNPARVFMGDTGSLAIGVGLPAIAVLTHRELLMIVVSLVFVIDGVSTIVQWAVFKYTRLTSGTGRRVFRKSPIHHHFELGGWPEQLVVIRFWVMGVIAAFIGFAGAAWRVW